MLVYGTNGQIVQVEPSRQGGFHLYGPGGVRGEGVGRIMGEEQGCCVVLKSF